MTQLDYGRFDTVLAKIAGNLSIDIQSWKKDGKNYSIVAALNTIPSLEKLDQAFAEMTEGSGRVVEASVRQISNEHDRPLVRFIATQNTVSQPYTEEGAKGMIAVKENLFIEKASEGGYDRIWNVVGEGTEKRLVLNSEDNLEELLAQRKTRQRVTASFQHETNFYNGDMVLYVTASGDVGKGIGLNIEGQPNVYDSKAGMLVAVDPTSVIEAMGGMGDENEDFKPVESIELVSNLSVQRANQVVDYLRKIYSSRPELMAKYEGLIDKMRGHFQTIFQNSSQNDELKNAMGRSGSQPAPTMHNRGESHTTFTRPIQNEGNKGSSQFQFK